MKKIITSLFVLSFMFLVSDVVNAKIVPDLIGEVNVLENEVIISNQEVEISSQVDVFVDENVPEVSIENEQTIENSSIKPDGTKPALVSEWINVGNPGFSSGYAVHPSFGLNSKNVPYLAYQDETNNFKVNVVKFDGTNWISVGNLGFCSETKNFSYTSLAFDKNDIPHVACMDSGKNKEKPILMKFNGESWININTNGLSAGLIFNNSIAFDSNNFLYLAYRDSASGNRATVKKFNGDSWVSVGNSGFSANSPYGLSLVIDSNNIPYVVFSDFNLEINIMKFSDNNWINVGNLSSGISGIWASLAINSKNVPYIAYVDLNYGKASVVQFDGKNWINVGDPGFSEENSSDTSLAFDSNDIPYVAYKGDWANNYKANTVKFDGTNWVNVGGLGFSEAGVDFTSLAIDSNNIPYVAFADYAYNGKATVMKYASIDPVLTIIYPNGGESFRLGSKFTATWKSSGMISSELLNIGLIQDRTNLTYSLVIKTQNDGEETVVIPSNIKASKYKLYIKTSNAGVMDLSDNFFTIY